MCVCNTREDVYYFLKKFGIEIRANFWRRQKQGVVFYNVRVWLHRVLFFFKSNIPKKRFFSGFDVWTSGLLNFVLNMETFFYFYFWGLFSFAYGRKQTILIGFENVMAMVTFFKWKNNEAILCQHYLYTQGNRNYSDFFFCMKISLKFFLKGPSKKESFFKI